MIKILLFISFFLSSLFSFLPENTNKQNSKITICQTSVNFETGIYSNKITNVSNVFLENDPTKSYSMPLLAISAKGEIILSWTEKDEQGMASFCLAFSNDNGKTFSEKKTIFTSAGIGNNRMFRARVLSKKDGSLVAVFANRGDAVPSVQGGRGGGRASNLVYTISKDAGNTWTTPASVDSDPKQGIMRGFFDAILMPNDEIAIAYLKDVANSTKHEERDLRLVISKNGILQPEKLIDAVVCDCCPINMLIDENGALNIIYRDNNDDIRDMATMVSTDNGNSFSTSKIIHNDGWKIQGCPHSGAVSSIAGNSALVAYYSGSDKEPGIRLATREGKKLLILDNSTAKNPYLIQIKSANLLLWEQADSENKTSKIAYRKIANNNVSDIQWIDESATATNAVALSVGDKTLVAYEIKQANNKVGLKISSL